MPERVPKMREADVEVPPTEATLSDLQAGGALRLNALTIYFLKLGAVGFGGPIALVGAMHRDLVEERRWIEEDDYRNGLALAQLAPGPLAAQLAIYLGWLKGRAFGAALIGLAFVLPSFLIVLALSAVYVRFGGIPAMQGAFYGVGAAVIAIISRSALKLSRKTLEKDSLLWGIFFVNAIATAVLGKEFVWLVVASGLLCMVVKTKTRPPEGALLLLPPWLVTGLHGPTNSVELGKILAFFAQAGAFVFGSGLAIVPFLHGGVVVERHWLTEQQFLDAVAVAMLTPGPVVITVAFIGYLVGGPMGACLAALGTFLPCYLFTVLPAPHFSKWVKNQYVGSLVRGVTAAATGAIAGAVIVLGKHALTDPLTVVVFGASLLVLWRANKIPEPAIVAFAALIGIVSKELLK